MSEQAAMSMANADMAQGGVLVKLISFSVALGILPIGSYFLSLKYLWKENSTFAAITAIVAANVVLAAYIITAFLEDRASTTSGSQPVEKETKKD
ncbi:hypothetical protein BYT27DRAFT_7182768, partial [Phlegmacium glaucopus]